MPDLLIFVLPFQEDKLQRVHFQDVIKDKFMRENYNYSWKLTSFPSVIQKPCFVQ